MGTERARWTPSETSPCRGALPAAVCGSGHLLALVLTIAAGAWLGACRSSAIISPGPTNERAKGTVAGLVTGFEDSDPAKGRLVEAVDTRTGARYGTLTDAAGGYTLLLPPGTYRLVVALARDESVVRQPKRIEVAPGGLRTGMDIILGGAGVVPGSVGAG